MSPDLDMDGDLNSGSEGDRAGLRRIIEASEEGREKAMDVDHSRRDEKIAGTDGCVYADGQGDAAASRDAGGIVRSSLAALLAGAVILSASFAAAPPSGATELGDLEEEVEHPAPPPAGEGRNDDGNASRPTGLYIGEDGHVHDAAAERAAEENRRDLRGDLIGMGMSLTALSVASGMANEDISQSHHAIIGFSGGPAGTNLTQDAMDLRVRAFSEPGFNLGATAGYLHYNEDLGGGNDDNLSFWRAAARAEYGSSRNALGFELGGRWMRGASRDRSGLDGMVTLDLSPIERVHLDAAWGAARLGASTLHETRVGVGYVWDAVELHLGYRNIGAGGAHIEGPEFGVIVRF